jgi:Zn finger protein HypA/HybF involved in hydrogenase expression
MDECALDAHGGAPLAIDICYVCQAFWFDAHESPRLSPGSTLSLFAKIGAKPARPTALTHADVAKCPRCRGHLRLTKDRQRRTVFSYLRCPNDHGRLTTFVDFLREKDFVKPLTGAELERLRRQLTFVHCSTCGAPVELATTSVCGHCGSPISTLDLPHTEQVVEQLQRAEAQRAPGEIDPTLPLRLAEARREVERAFEAQPHESAWLTDAASTGLVGAGLATIARWLTKG